MVKPRKLSSKERTNVSTTLSIYENHQGNQSNPQNAPASKPFQFYSSPISNSDTTPKPGFRTVTRLYSVSNQTWTMPSIPSASQPSSARPTTQTARGSQTFIRHIIQLRAIKKEIDNCPCRAPPTFDPVEISATGHEAGLDFSQIRPHGGHLDGKPVLREPDVPPRTATWRTLNAKLGRADSTAAQEPVKAPVKVFPDSPPGEA